MLFGIRRCVLISAIPETASQKCVEGHALLAAGDEKKSANPLQRTRSNPRTKRAEGTSQGNNTDSLVGLPRKVIAAARLH